MNNTKKLLLDLINVVKKLRSSNGCEWDRKQTSKSLIPYMLEETYEVIEAIEIEDYKLLNEELGDLLLHIVFQSELIKEKSDFDLDSALECVIKKLIDRHPHIFRDSNSSDYEEEDWELKKQKEKKRKYLLDGIAKELPALRKAQRIQEKASSVDFDWKNHKDITKKILEELDELTVELKNKNIKGIEEELGDLLFSIVNLARFYNISAEDSLRATIKKFHHRFNYIEDSLKSIGKKLKDADIQTMEELWKKSKISDKS